MFPKNVAVAEMNSTCVTGESLFVVAVLITCQADVYTHFGWMDSFTFVYIICQVPCARFPHM